MRVALKYRWIAIAIMLGVIAATVPAGGAGTPNPVAPVGGSQPQLDPAFHVDMRQVIEYLASDQLEGRLAGTPGIERAAEYIQSAFSRLGLRTVPAAPGYFQHFQMALDAQPDVAKSILEAGNLRFALERDFLPLYSSGETQVRGPLAFAGYGIVNPARQYDDYGHLDVKGKAVLVMRYEPHTSDGRSRWAAKGWSDDASIAAKVKTAGARGAAAVLLVNPPIHHGEDGLVPFEARYPFKADIPVIQVTPATADALLKLAGGQDLKTLQGMIEQTGRPAPVALQAVPVHVSVGIDRTMVPVENVIGVLSGGMHPDEYVVVGAHYDHLGHGGVNSVVPWSHAIHPGADDNASGVAAMLSIADRLSHGPAPARSILFVAFTGEEEGMVGSEYFVEHWPVPREKIVAMLNMDMVGRVRQGKLLTEGDEVTEVFPELLRKTDQGLPLMLSHLDTGAMGGSDHMSFMRKNIPSICFFTSLHMDYHRPTDTPDKIDYQGLEEVVELGVRLTSALSTIDRATLEPRRHW